MSKITRWKGGLKEGNRREVDMTDGSFNSKYSIIKPDVQTEVPIEWKVEIVEKGHALETQRKEEKLYSTKAAIEGSVHSDIFIVENLGGGVVYQDPLDPMVRRAGLRVGTNEIDTLILSNPDSGLDIMIKDSKELRVVEALGTPEWDPTGLIPTTDSLITDDWSFEFNAVQGAIFQGLRMYMEGEGVVYRVSYTSPNGRVWFENLTQYEYDNVPELWDDYRIGPGPTTEILYPDPFYLDLGDPLTVRIQTQVPTLRRGIYLGPGQTNFLQSADAYRREAKVTVLTPSKLVHSRDTACYEWAVRGIASPNSIHLEDLSIVLDQECEYIEWLQ